ncbi:hypothetical protein KR50_01350 [Jeotgalibacillus campisalis]|uniref:Uncharacterized protein n=1 Tax=Jeotgalibacillus campisalis TaxID=220754 RepID=A0A0C2W886_9BACL|nr:hypothetical protein KR50_01350 [Jeotgalibacillus campisalis]
MMSPQVFFPRSFMRSPSSQNKYAAVKASPVAVCLSYLFLFIYDHKVAEIRLLLKIDSIKELPFIP